RRRARLRQGDACDEALSARARRPGGRRRPPLRGGARRAGTLGRRRAVATSPRRPATRPLELRLGSRPTRPPTARFTARRGESTVYSPLPGRSTHRLQRGRESVTGAGGRQTAVVPPAVGTWTRLVFSPRGRR